MPSASATKSTSRGRRLSCRTARRHREAPPRKPAAASSGKPSYAIEVVVRTRVYVTSADDWEEIGRAHGEVFGQVRPASAMLVITGLLDPRFLVEIEADAIVA